MKKNTFFLIIIGIILLGAFLRSWHFSDWLHFELDQSRDAKVISLALEKGPENLPLLGPRAGGTFLRLGPAFYYLQYLSGLFFGNTPPGIAAANLILSIAAIIVFYFLCREYFSRLISVLLLAIFSASFFLVMYSRFAWNPNSLIFFGLMAFWALLKLVKKEEKNKGWWLVVFAFSLAVATQLHFLALLSFPVIGAIFLIIKRPKICWKYWLASGLVILLLYTPVILNETKTGGANAKEFIKAISGKSNKEDHSLTGSAVRDFQENSLANWLILSGSEKGEVLRPEQIQNPKVFCDKDCRGELPYTIAAYVIFALGIILLLKNLLVKNDQERRNFIWLTVIWLTVVLVLYIPLAYDISPRFFLLLAPAYVILFGFILEFIMRFKKKWLVILIVAGFIASNLYFIYQRFNEMKLAGSQNVQIQPDRILKEKARVTLEQEMAIAGYTAGKFEKNSLPVYVKSEAQYDRAFKYLISRMVPARDFNIDDYYRRGNYFLIWRTSSDIESKNSKYLPLFNISEKKDFGTLTVFYLQPKSEIIRDIPERAEDDKPNSKVPRRYTWKEFFSGGSDNEDDDNSEEESLMKEEGL